jgi:TP901 family phage tail tape measure protein
MADIKLNIVTATNMQGLNQLEAKLKDLKKLAESSDSVMVGTYSAVEIQKTVNAVNTLQHALRAAYDTKLNTVNIEKFNQYLTKSKMSVQDLYINLSRMGAEGRKVFMDMTQQTLMMGRSVKQTNALVTEMQTTMKNTVKWGISSGLWNNMLSSVSQAWTYVKGLNSDLNDIRIVTGKSADQMERFAKTANKTAKELAVSTRDYTQGALLYYQQGDDEETVKTKTDITAKASNVTGQDMATVSEQLTAVWNGYQVANQAAEEGMQVYEEYVDKLAAVAATTASDLEEQATAMSKVASAAYSMGVGFDDLNAQIATIESVTRQAPESVGTALKTIYARLGDLKVDGVDEFGVKLGEVSSQLKIMGVDILDSNGNMKDMSIIMEDVASKWQLWTREQKQAAAIAMAGKRQYNNLFALFENQDMYNKALSTSMEANGTLAEQQAIAVEDLDSKLQKLETSTEKIYDALFDEESVGGLIDAFTVVVDLIGSAVQGIGGLGVLIPAIGGKLLKSFGSDIGNAVAKKVENKRVRARELKNDDAKLQLAAQLGDSGQFLKEDEGQQNSLMAKEQKVVTDYYKNMARFRKNMTDEEIVAYNTAMKNRAEVANIKLELQETVDLLQVQNQLTEEQYNIISKVNKGEKITEEEAKQLEILKEKVQQQRLLVEQAKAQVETDQLKPVNVGIEISRKQKTLTMEDLKNKSETAVSGIVTGAYGQNADANDIKRDINVINEVLIEARKNGLQAEQAISFVKERLEETSDIGYGDSIFNDLRTVYQDMEKDTKAFSENVGNVFDEQIGEKLKESLGDDTKDVIEELRKKVVELTKQGKTFEEAYTEAIEGIGDEATKVEKTLQDIDISNIDLDNADFEIKGLLETQELKTAMEGLSSAAGGVIQIFAGLSGVMNSFKSAMDPSLDTTERLSAAFTGLISSGFIIVSAINSITQATNSLKTATNAQTTAEALRRVVMTVIGKLSKQNAQNTANETAQMRNNTEAVHENTAALIANEAAERATQSAMSSTTAAATTVGGAMTTMGGAATTSAGSTAAAGGAVAGLGTAAAAAGAALVALVAIIAVVVISMEAHQKALEEDMEAAQEAHEEQLKRVESTKKEKDAIDAVIKSYEDLSKQYEDGDLSLSELREKTIDLCLEYGQQDLALKALIADYETLNGLMKQAQSEADVAFVEESEKALDTGKIAIQTALTANAKGSTRDTTNGKDSLDIIDGIYANSDEKKIQKLLSEYGVKTVDGHVYTEDFANAIANNYDEIYAGLGKIDGDIAQELRTLMDSVSEKVDSYETVKDEVIATKKKILADKFNGSSIKSVSDYSSAINTMASDAEEYFDNPEEAKEWATSTIQGKMDAEGMRYAQQYQIITNIADAEGKDIDTVLNEIQDKLNTMSDTEISIMVNLNWNQSNFEDYDFSKIADFETYKQAADLVENLLMKTEKLSDVELDSLFKNEQFVDYIKVSKEEFESWDLEGQQRAIANFYSGMANEAMKYKDSAAEASKENTQKLKEEKEKVIDDYIKGQRTTVTDAELKEATSQAYGNNAWSLYNAGYWNASGGWEDIGIEEVETAIDAVAQKMAQYNLDYEKALEAVIAEGGKNKTVLTEKHVQAFLDAYDYETKTEIRAAKKGKTISKELRDELIDKMDEETKAVVDDIQKSIEASTDYSAAIEGFEINYKAQVIADTTNLDNGLKSVQSFANEFQSLNDVINDYNENGGYTVDNLMTLASMSSEMLSTLEFENGALKINAEALKQVALAKIDDSIASAMSLAQTRLQALAEGDLQAAQIDTTKATYMEKAAVESLTGALAGGEQQFLAYLEARSGITGEDYSDTYKKYAGQVVSDAMSTITPLMNIRDQIANGDFSLLGGDTSAKDKELKILDDEFDRYWDLNNIIEKTSKSIEELSEAQSKLTRGELQENLKEQNKLLEQQVVNYQNLRKEQEKEANELKGKLLTFGVDFNADGSIANYEEATQEALNYYNNLIERRKVGKITDAQLETGEKSYEKFKETLEKYDSLFYDEMVQTADNISDTQRQILENNLKDFEVGIQIVIDEEDFNRNLNDFLEQANNDITKHFEDLNSRQQYISFDVQSYQTSLDATLKGYAQVAEEVKKLADGQSSTMFESLSQAQEKLKELTEDSIEYASNIGNAFEEAWDNYLEGIDQADDQLQEAMEGYERINETLEYQAELIELIYGPEAYDLLDALYKQQQNNSLSQIQSLKAQKDMWAELYESAAGNSEDQVKYFELMNKAQSQLNENVTSYIELLKNEYANTIDNILSKLENTLANGSTFEDIGEQWERMTEHTDKYYDSLESIYHMQTLSNNVAQDIANISDVKDQQKLQKVLDKQLKLLREKENLSQTDLDIAQKKLDIVKAEIALEEARASKTSMRLVRNYDGNWSYQYIADADNVAIKQQELIDLQYELYQLNQDAYTSTLEAITNLEQTTLEKWKEIATSEVLNQEEKEAKIAELLAYYTEQKDLLVEESEVYKQGLVETTAGLAWSLYQSDADNFEEMTNKEQELVLALQDTTVDSYADIEEKVKENLDNIGDKAHTVATENIPELTSAAANFATEWVRDEDGVRATVQKAIDDMMAAMDQFQIKVDEVAGVVEGDFGEEGIKGAIDSTTTATQAVETAITNLCNNTPSKLATLKTNVDKIAGAWEDVKDQIEDATTALSNYYALEVPPKDGTGNTNTNTDNKSNTGSGNNSGWTPITDNFDITVDDKDYQIYSVSPHGDGKYMLAREEERMSVPIATHKTKKEMLQEIQKVINTGALVKFQGIKWSSEVGDIIQYATDAEVRAGSFDTGGYTGEWGATGKMAFLHEKELILNKEDTKNILAAVNGIRQFSSVESAITKGIASMIMNMAGMSVNANYNTNEAEGNQTKQVFNITAEFPSANNVSEIREAILSLPGLASQQVGLNLI